MVSANCEVSRVIVWFTFPGRFPSLTRREMNARCSLWSVLVNLCVGVLVCLCLLCLVVNSLLCLCPVLVLVRLLVLWQNMIVWFYARV